MDTSPQTRTAAFDSALMVPVDLQCRLLTSLDWKYAELRLLRSVCKEWRNIIDTTPKLDAVLFREAPAACPQEVTPKTSIHPIFSHVKNLLVLEFDEITINASGKTILLRDLPSVLEEQAFSPPATRAGMCSDENDCRYLGPDELLVLPETPGGLTVRDVFEYEMRRMAQWPSISRCGHPGCCDEGDIQLVEVFQDERREFKGYSVVEFPGEPWNGRCFLDHNWRWLASNELE